MQQSCGRSTVPTRTDLGGPEHSENVGAEMQHIGDLADVRVISSNVYHRSASEDSRRASDRRAPEWRTWASNGDRFLQRQHVEENRRDSTGAVLVQTAQKLWRHSSCSNSTAVVNMFVVAQKPIPMIQKKMEHSQPENPRV